MECAKYMHGVRPYLLNCRCHCRISICYYHLRCMMKSLFKSTKNPFKERSVSVVNREHARMIVLQLLSIVINGPNFSPYLLVACDVSNKMTLFENCHSSGEEHLLVSKRHSLNIHQNRSLPQKIDHSGYNV